MGSRLIYNLLDILLNYYYHAGVSIIEVVTSQMVVYSSLGLLQVIIMTLTTIYAFDVCT